MLHTLVKRIAQRAYQGGIRKNGGIKEVELDIKRKEMSIAQQKELLRRHQQLLENFLNHQYGKQCKKRKKNGTQHDSYSELDKFDFDEYLTLMKMCRKYKIEFMTTPFDVRFVEFFDKAGMNCVELMRSVRTSRESKNGCRSSLSTHGG